MQDYATECKLMLKHYSKFCSLAIYRRNQELLDIINTITHIKKSEREPGRGIVAQAAEQSGKGNGREHTQIGNRFGINSQVWTQPSDDIE